MLTLSNFVALYVNSDGSKIEKRHFYCSFAPGLHAYNSRSIKDILISL